MSCHFIALNLLDLFRKSIELIKNLINYLTGQLPLQPSDRYRALDHPSECAVTIDDDKSLRFFLGCINMKGWVMCRYKLCKRITFHGNSISVCTNALIGWNRENKVGVGCEGKVKFCNSASSGLLGYGERGGEKIVWKWLVIEQED